jgi:hypothetical protein
MMMKVLLERPKLFSLSSTEKKFNQVIFEIDLLVQSRTNLWLRRKTFSSGFGCFLGVS